MLSVWEAERTVSTRAEVVGEEETGDEGAVFQSSPFVVAATSLSYSSHSCTRLLTLFAIKMS